MKTRNKMYDILTDLYKIDPDLKQEEKNLWKIIRELLSSRPGVLLDGDFKDELKRELVAKLKGEDKSRQDRQRNKTRKVIFFSASGAAAALLAVLFSFKLLMPSLSSQRRHTPAVIDAQTKGDTVGKEEFDQPPAAPREEQKAALSFDKPSSSQALPKNSEQQSLKGKTGDGDSYYPVSSFPRFALTVEPQVLANSSLSSSLAQEPGAAGDDLPSQETQPDKIINAFQYNYPAPETATPYSLYSELGICPWDSRHYLLLVGLQGQTTPKGAESSGGLSGAVDITFQITFHPPQVHSYRVIGHDSLTSVPEQLNQQQSLTLLFEIVPGSEAGSPGEAAARNGAASGSLKRGQTQKQLAFAQISYPIPQEDNTLIISREIPLRVREKMSSTYLWAASVAAWSRLLSRPEDQREIDWSMILAMAKQAARGHQDRQEFLPIMEKSRTAF